MIRTVSATATAAATLALFAAAPVAAQGGAYYTATTTAPAKKPSLVTRNTIWKCDDTVCTAGKAPDRDAVVCAMIAQRVGPLAAFTVNGTAFADDALEKCNGGAK